MRAPPRNLRQAEIEISKRTRERDIAEIEPIVYRRDDFERPRNCTVLPRYPIVPSPLRRPAALDDNREGRIDQSLHQCDARHHLKAISADERAAMANRVKIFADDRAVRDHRAVVGDERGHFADGATARSALGSDHGSI